MVWKKIAIFGGTFNPVHQGHTYWAKFLKKELKLNELWFLVSKIHLTKSLTELLPLTSRLILLNESAPYPWVRFKTIERDRDITYYQLRLLKIASPRVVFYFVMGYDVYYDFRSWRGSSWIRKNYSIFVLPRSRVLANLPFGRRSVVFCSSTNIRLAKDIEFCLSAPVKKILLDRAWFFDIWLWNNLDFFRVKHSLRIAFIALLLADSLSFLPFSRSVFQAAIFHDFSKKKAAEMGGKNRNPLIHAVLGAQWARKTGFSSRVVSAIATHTSLDKIDLPLLNQLIFAADKLEKERKYLCSSYPFTSTSLKEFICFSLKKRFFLLKAKSSLLNEKKFLQVIDKWCNVYKV